MKRSQPLRSSRLRPVGKRAERDLEERLAFRSNPPERCERCNRRRRLHAHHILPRSRGGKHTPDNRAWLCGYCHEGVHAHRDDWRNWTR